MAARSTRPATPPGVATGTFTVTPSRVPLSMSTVSRAPAGPRRWAMTRAPCTLQARGGE